MIDTTPKEKAQLLAQLKLNRSPTASSDLSKSSVRLRFFGAGLALVAALTIGIVSWTYGAKSPKKDDASTTASVVAQSTQSVQAAPRANSPLLEASGYVVARRRATVSAKSTGKVLAVFIEEGQKIRAGDVMARLDDSNWLAALDEAKAQLEQSRASVQAQKTALEDAQAGFTRVTRQMQVGAISMQAFDTEKAIFNAKKAALTIAERSAEAAAANVTIARRNLEDTIVRAPFSGVVTEKAAQPGEIVSPTSAGGGFTRTGIGTVVDMDSLEVEVDVGESFIERVRADQPVTIRLNAYPDWDIAGKVIATIPAADRAKATIRVRIAFDARDERIIPDMGAHVAFLAGSSVKLTALL